MRCILLRWRRRSSPRSATWLLLRLVTLVLLIGPLGCRQNSPAAVAVSSRGALAPVAGNDPIDGEIRRLQQTLGGPAAGDADAWLRLAQALIRKARQARDERIYAQADDAAARALRLAPDLSGAHYVQLAVLLHDHRFRDAQTRAAALLRRSPRDATAWGALGDSAVELGDYSAAQQAYQAMLDVKPDLRSYSRGAWLRYLLGDGDGAIELMGQAIDAGSPRDPESKAYCRVQRAELLALRGRYTESQVELDRALQDLPSYAPARAARGRLLLHALGDPATALPELAAALAQDPQLSTRISLLEAHEALGHAGAASEQHRLILLEGPRQDPRTLALFLASRREQTDRAVWLAEDEAQQRPDLWSLDALAWAQHQAGRSDRAWPLIQRATEPGIIDPRIDYHLGVIAEARGDRARARSALRRALSTSPGWDRRDTAEATALLRRMEATERAP